MPKEPGMKDCILLTYSLAKLSQKEKVRILRELLGYSNRKEKVYHHEGLIEAHHAEKIAQNVLLVPSLKAARFISFFGQNKVAYEFREVQAKL
ncbi:hypothetical protein HYV84_06675 [Candidatus Woesearchaeota archaeon]|nr:hypothetical protein [Candidatus Woesearchaeota archaeon]